MSQEAQQPLPTPVLPYEPSPPAALERGLGLPQAVALNITNMVGIGPFITIPLFITAMGGPQALIGWVVAAVLVLCDGLVWSELGAALPGSGGTYHFLREIFGTYRWGRLLPFLFIWQFLISGTLELASGYIGASDYLRYALPKLEPALWRWHVYGGFKTLGAATCLCITFLLCRRIRVVGWYSLIWFAGTLITVLIVIVTGLWHFDSSLLKPPPNAFKINWAWAIGLGAAMRIAIYDFLGYYNICHLGDEVRSPGKTIPRAVILSVVIIAVLYFTMNLAIIGVVPWQEAMKSKSVASEFMQRLFGHGPAVAFTWCVLWTAIACQFAATLGYSRIPYAAARGGDFFRIFSYVHPTRRSPVVSLFAVGGLTAVFCFFSLATVIDAAVTVRILVQFVSQIAALHVLRTKRPDVPMPFRMWLYPIPSLLALIGWIFVWATAGNMLLLWGLGLLVLGCIVFVIWQQIIERNNIAEQAAA